MAVGIYGQKLTIVDLRDEETAETILAQAQEGCCTWPDPWGE